MPQPPALLVSALLALGYGAAYYLWRGKRLVDLPFFVVASLMGFACGWLGGAVLDLLPATLGQIHLIEATLAAFVFLVAADWLRTKGPSE